jgi:hypothetical protein
MDTHHLKAEVEKNVEKLATLRDEVRLKLHLATLDAKTEWDEKLSPRVFEAEQMAKELTESSRSGLSELIDKLEDFLERLRATAGKSEHAPPSSP